MICPEFPDTFWSFKYALKFIHKKASSPPLGLATVAAMLPADWKIRITDMNIKKLTDRDIQWADMIFISAMNAQQTSVSQVLSKCKSFSKTIVAGGPLFTGEWDKFPEIDHFVLNEAEITLPEFLRDLQNQEVKKIYSTQRFADITQTPMPRWDLIKINDYDSICIQFSRGCPFNCDFCNVTALLGHKPRTKSVAQIIKELDYIYYDLGWRRNIFFVDDNFICNKQKVKDEILPAIIAWRKNKVGCNFITEASINLSDDQELMRLMSKAGFVSVFVGVETPEEDSLTECNKKQNTKRNLIESIRSIQNNGLQVMGGFIVGFDNDKPSIFKKQIDFIQQSGIVTAMVGILQAPYGTELYARLEKEGRILQSMSGNNTDGSTNIIPQMGIEKLNAGYAQILHEIYDAKNFYHRIRTCLKNWKPSIKTVNIEWQEVFALFKSIWLLGITGKERLEYWKLFFWSLIKYPKKFPQAITFSIYGYHFRRIIQQNDILK
jgi:radical SAM superfamily enzyme YgiQ (UPF0313 family)